MNAINNTNTTSTITIPRTENQTRKALRAVEAKLKHAHRFLFEQRMAWLDERKALKNALSEWKQGRAKVKAMSAAFDAAQPNPFAALEGLLKG